MPPHSEMIYEGIIEKYHPGKKRWQMRFGVVTRSQIMLFKGDTVYNSKPSEVIPVKNLKDTHLTAVETSKDMISKRLELYRPFLEKVRDGVGAQEHWEMDKDLNDGPFVFTIETNKATIECRTALFMERGLWI